MKRISAFLLSILLVMSLSVTAFAAEDDTQIDVYAKVVRNIEGEYAGEVKDDEASTVTDDGIVVSVTGAPDEAVALMVVPVPKTEAGAWEWITSCLNGTGTPIHTFDIYFLDQDGTRLNANGAVVTINCPHCSGTPLVCSLTTSGAVRVLSDSNQGAAVTFTTDGSTYYVIAEKASSGPTDEEHDVTIKDTDSGDVTISDPTPETGDDVTITPKPDDGKKVDKVIVKDENGNEIPVTDNGDGTYTYEQPDGDVTIEVVFKDETTAPDNDHDVTIKEPTGGDVGVSDTTPETGDKVTITPKPDNGKEVDKIIVKDENGNTIPVTDNGDGTYTYEQPDGDVTIEVTFKDKAEADPNKPDVPQTGDNSNLWLWFMLLIASAAALFILLIGKRKKEEDKTA